MNTKTHAQSQAKKETVTVRFLTPEGEVWNTWNPTREDYNAFLAHAAKHGMTPSEYYIHLIKEHAKEVIAKHAEQPAA